MFEFEYPESSLALAKATLQSNYKDSKLFLSAGEDPSLVRYELSLKTLNWIFSGKYWGEKTGFVLGKLYNFWGLESVGKSALALQITADIINGGGRGQWVDMERSSDPDYMRSAYGIDVEDEGSFHLVLPDYGEQGYDAVKTYIDARSISISTIDSVAASGTARTQNAEKQKHDVASLALVTSQHLQKIIKPANDAKCSVIYINQVRENLISVGGMMMAAGKKFTGGIAMKHYPHVELFFKKVKDLTTGDDEFFAQEILIHAKKNKVSIPHRKGNFILVPGEGFSVGLDILMLATREKVCTKKGAYWYYGDQAVGQGLRQCHIKLKEFPEMLEEIWEKTKWLLHPADSFIPTDEIMPEEETVIDVPKATKKKIKKTTAKKK